MGARRRRWSAIVVVAAISAACGAAPTRTAGRAAPGQKCAWAVRADKTTLNIAYPDTAATYWSVSYSLAPGEYLELHGRFPWARYISFISYGPVGGVVDVLSDRDVVPDRGSTNPFTAGVATRAGGGRYTVTVRSETSDASSNVVRAAGAAPVATSTTSSATSPADPAQANRLGSGGPTGVRGTLLYRVYVSGRPGDPTGGTGLPAVSVVGADGHRTDVATCAAPGGSPAAIDLVQRNGPATDSPAPGEPTFVRPQTRAANLYPDPDNVYIATILHYVPGRIAVVTAKAPTFPDPAHGRAVGTGEQVRYWSMCTNEYRKPYPVTTCAADQQTALDAAGRFTYVISTPQDRPANATAANGVTWLDWGSTNVDVLLLLRNMLASPTFPESAVNVAPGALATTSMGAYAPRGAYCTTSAFERGDPSCRPA